MTKPSPPHIDSSHAYASYRLAFFPQPLTYPHLYIHISALMRPYVGQGVTMVAEFRENKGWSPTRRVVAVWTAHRYGLRFHRGRGGVPCGSARWRRTDGAGRLSRPDASMDLGHRHGQARSRARPRPRGWVRRGAGRMRSGEPTWTTVSERRRRREALAKVEWLHGRGTARAAAWSATVEWWKAFAASSHRRMLWRVKRGRGGAAAAANRH